MLNASKSCKKPPTFSTQLHLFSSQFDFCWKLRGVHTIVYFFRHRAQLYWLYNAVCALQLVATARWRQCVHWVYQLHYLRTKDIRCCGCSNQLWTYVKWKSHCRPVYFLAPLEPILHHQYISYFCVYWCYTCWVICSADGYELTPGRSNHAHRKSVLPPNN